MRLFFATVIIFLSCNSSVAQHFGINAPKTIERIESLSTTILEAWNHDTIQKVRSDSLDLTLTRISSCLNLKVHHLGFAIKEDKIRKEKVRFFFFEKELIKMEVINDDFRKHYFYKWKKLKHSAKNISAQNILSAKKFAKLL